jgi:hypothetical protein
MFDKSGMRYVFEKMGEGKYQVRLNGEFVCYSNHTDPEGIDQVLQEYGYSSRKQFVEYMWEQHTQSLREGN